MAEHWYTYPLQMLDSMPERDYQIIRLEDLSKDVKSTIESLYQKFNLRLTENFCKLLNQATHKSRKYQSKHQYNLKAMGLSLEEVETNFKEIFNRFDFKKPN
jgi:hypothetical protein